MKPSPDELRSAVERAEHKLNLARKKFSQFKNNEMDVTDPSHRRGLRWLDDEVSKAETELASARHNWRTINAWCMHGHARAFVQFR